MLTVNTVPVVSPANGVLNLNSNGTYTYIPNTNFNGNDTFVYEVSDGNGRTDMGTVNIIVVPINDAPDAIDDTTVLDGAEDTTTGTLNATLLGNDNDLEGDAISITAINGTTLTGGVQGIAVTNGMVNIDAADNITFTADANYNGVVNFTYTINDGSLTDTATVSGTISAVNDAPVFESISDITVYDGDVINFTITANDPDADPLAYSSTTLPDGATLNTQTGIFNWIAKREKGKNGGTFNIAFEVSDGELVDSQTMTIFVEKTSGGGKPKKGK